ncbi:fla cluster protein FlaF [Halorussus salinisoli]|uniref:fla cluster protein FlaF n=1 Tax=Halorussus salinisoli TaxID=2558242 RepID=UPI0010C24050|nr:fla cluster protein FlaF [Halorussus salinisoli]
MGFSVSGSTVVLFLGIFISFGVAYSAANNGFERVNEAYEENADGELVRQNTEIDIADAAVANEGGEAYLNVAVDNNGSTTLSVNDTDILIDGNYTPQTSQKMVTVEVDGNSETDLWLPGETLQFNVSVTDPDRVKVVTGPGVATAEVI